MKWINQLGRTSTKPIMRNLISNLILYCTWKLKSIFQQRYSVGGVKIVLPPKHTLPYFQSKHPLYDRFLPILAKYVDKDGIIVDVGANVGDTAIMMMENFPNHIYCFEPSSKFFPYLAKNTSEINNLGDRLQIFKEMVGTGRLSGSLTHNAGTASFSVGEDFLSDESFLRLDNLVEAERKVSMIKVDVDGFDFDVLLSSEKIIENHHPILFWENQILQDFQFDGFNSLYRFLEEKEYEHVFVFDNFGNLVLEDTDFNSVKNLNNYTDSMNRHSCSRTFFYTDILASTKENYSKVKMALADYKSNWIFRSSKS